MNDPRPQRVEPEPALGQPTTAFDGLAPAFREADAFSDSGAVPLNDAAFGGAQLSRSDEYHVPESPETAARLANGPENDFAEDDFWNRTDEEDGLTPMNVPPAPPAPPVSPAADHEDLAALVVSERRPIPRRRPIPQSRSPRFPPKRSRRMPKPPVPVKPPGRPIIPRWNPARRLHRSRPCHRKCPLPRRASGDGSEFRF